MGGLTGKEKEERRARLEALCLYIKKPPDYDINANAEEALQILDDLYETREWTAPDGARVRVFKQRSSICFRPIEEEAPTPPNNPGEGTADEADAIRFLGPWLDKPLSELPIKFHGDDSAMEKEFNKFLEDNKDVTLRRILEYGGDAFGGDLRVFLRVCKLNWTPDAATRAVNGLPYEAVKPLLKKQSGPAVVPLRYHEFCPEGEENKTAMANATLSIRLCSVEVKHEKRALALWVEQLCHKMAKKDKVVMVKTIRKRGLTQPSSLAFCTQGSTRRGSMGKKLRPDDRVECWVLIHAAKRFRAPTEKEHEGFLAERDRSNKVVKKHADKKRSAQKEDQDPNKKAKKGALG